MALHYPLLLTSCSTNCLTQKSHPHLTPNLSQSLQFHPNISSSLSFHYNHPFPAKSLSTHRRRCAGAPGATRVQSSDDDEDDDNDDGPSLMTECEREDLRRKIRQVIDMNPNVEEETDPVQRKTKIEKLLADYPLIVEEDDPTWTDDADGRGFKLDQFFNKITIKNVKKDTDTDEDDSDKEIEWQDDDYIRAVKDIAAADWEDTVFRDFNPLVVLVHNRYKRPRENEKARSELERAIEMFWESGLPSPRCVAVDAVIEEEITSALGVSAFPEILFTKAGKILYRDREVRTADEWSKIMAFFYYKAVRPACLESSAGQSQERIPSLS